MNKPAIHLINVGNPMMLCIGDAHLGINNSFKNTAESLHPSSNQAMSYSITLSRLPSAPNSSAALEFPKHFPNQIWHGDRVLPRILKVMRNHSGLGVHEGTQKHIPLKASLVSPTGEDYPGVCTQRVPAMWFRRKYKELKYAMSLGC